VAGRPHQTGSRMGGFGRWAGTSSVFVSGGSRMFQNELVNTGNHYGCSSGNARNKGPYRNAYRQNRHNQAFQCRVGYHTVARRSVTVSWSSAERSVNQSSRFSRHQNRHVAVMPTADERTVIVCLHVSTIQVFRNSVRHAWSPPVKAAQMSAYVTPPTGIRLVVPPTELLTSQPMGTG